MLRGNPPKRKKKGIIVPPQKKETENEKKMDYDTDYARGVAGEMVRAGLPVVYHVLFGGGGEMRHDILQLPTSLFVTDAPSSLPMARNDVGTLLRYLERRSDSELHGRSPRTALGLDHAGADAAVVQAVAENGARIDALRLRIDVHEVRGCKRKGPLILR